MVSRLLSKLIRIISPLISDDKTLLHIRYRVQFHKKLNLESPTTYNEKLQWLKLYDRNPQYTPMVDKYAAKQIIEEKIGEQYVIPTLGIWNDVDDIDFDNLPNSFVLKTTHGGGNTGVVICRDKKTFNYKLAKQKLRRSLKEDLYVSSREWPYKNVPRRIIAEELLINNDSLDLPDYKFFCFDGEVKALFVATERSTGNVKFDFFDPEFNHLNLVQVHPMSNKQIQKPQQFEKMLDLARILSKGFPHVRIDMYVCNNKIYIGEFTFYHHGGFVPFHPEEYDKLFGEWLNLPSKS